MKKKILISLVACFIAAGSFVHYNFAQNNHNTDISLADISVMAQATDGESANWAYAAKLTAEPLYDQYVTTTGGVTGWFKLIGGGFEIAVVHFEGLAGEIKNCTFWLTARCDQNLVGVFYFPDPPLIDPI